MGLPPLDGSLLITGAPRSGKSLVRTLLEPTGEFLVRIEPSPTWATGATDRRDDVRSAEDATAHTRRRIRRIHIIPRFGSLQDQRDALAEVARELKPGGRLLFNFRNAASLLYGRIDKQHAATYAEIEDALHELGLDILEARGKWFLNGRLIDMIGAAPARVVAAADRALWGFAPRRAWDVLLLARKRG